MAGGYVMNIQDFSVNDGEGIRTNIFLAGCPLTCAWCSNPEGQTLQNAMTSYMTVEEVTDKVKKQMIFYRMSGGGVTFSGGEATVQQEFLRCLAGRLYDMGISLAIETCGQFAFEEVKDILGKMDLIFYDIKHMDAGKHRIFTGISNEKILSNRIKDSQAWHPAHHKGAGHPWSEYGWRQSGKDVCVREKGSALGKAGTASLSHVRRREICRAWHAAAAGLVPDTVPGRD